MIEKDKSTAMLTFKQKDNSLKTNNDSFIFTTLITNNMPLNSDINSLNAKCRSVVAG